MPTRSPGGCRRGVSAPTRTWPELRSISPRAPEITWSAPPSPSMAASSMPIPASRATAGTRRAAVRRHHSSRAEIIQGSVLLLNDPRASSPRSVREARETRAFTRKLIARSVQLHREGCVISTDANHVDDTLLAEPLLGCAECGVRHPLVLLKFDGEVVHDCFIGSHCRGAATVGNCMRSVPRYSLLERDRLVAKPLVVLRPLASRDQYYKLAQRISDSRPITQIIAGRSGNAHHLRTMHHRFERAKNRHFARGQKLLG